MRQLAALALTLATLLLTVNLIRATCTTEEDCANQINQQNSQLTSIQKQQADLQKQLDAAKKNLNSTTAQLNAIQAQVDSIQAQLTKAEADLKNAQGVLDENKAVFRARVRDDYIHGAVAGWELLFGESYSFADAVYEAGTRQVLISRNRSAIIQYTDEVKNLDATRTQIAEASKVAKDQLAQITAIKNSQAAQVTTIQKNQSALSSQINQINANLKGLTSTQQQIIAAKLAANSQSTTVGSGVPASSTLPASPFHPGFVFLTYGYPHRIGMNQYGAYGRALSSDPNVNNFQAILQVYYGRQATPANMPATIKVNGCNDYGQCFNNQVFAYEDYLKHLYEMPSSWPMEALKAQAVAARTYALKYGPTICPSQSCQEVKQEINATAWQQAVDATAGLTLGGNSPINAYYSSTDGGYTCTDFQHNNPCTMFLHDVDGSGVAWDGPGHGDSPWYHKAWGSNSNGGTPWLTAEETADMFNAVTLSQTSSTYNQYLSPIDKGGWSITRVRNQLTSLGKNYVDAAATIGVGFDGQGNTSYIWVIGSNGVYYRYNGADFQAMFNLRSPGTLGLMTSQFDVQKAN